MSIAQTAVYFVGDNPFTWRADWAWGLPLIVLTVLIHVSGLLLISQRVVHGAGPVIERRHPKLAFVVVLCSTTLLATCLHGLGVCREYGITILTLSFELHCAAQNRKREPRRYLICLPPNARKPLPRSPGMAFPLDCLGHLQGSPGAEQLEQIVGEA